MKIVTRKQARAAGAKRYFTGKPCPHGHVCERMVINTDCIKCMRVRRARRYRDNAEYRKRQLIRSSKYYWADPEKFRRRAREDYYLIRGR